MDALSVPTREAVLAPPKSLLAPTFEEIEAARQQPLRLFHAAATRVPAYAAFLREHGVDPASVRTLADLRAVPPVSKAAYLRKHALPALCWDGLMAERGYTFTSTSGSSGSPFYFPRPQRIDDQSGLLFELYLHGISRGQTKSTLFIVMFGMGVWIGGVISYWSLRHAAQRGFPVTVITPGPNKKEILGALRTLAPHYEQVVLGGYPPFVQDVIEEAQREGIDTGALPLKLFYAAEVWTEEMRDHALRQTRNDEAPEFSSGGIYGTADLGTMALETPAAIAVRRLARANPALRKALFGTEDLLPTLAQFHPAMTDFSAEDGKLLLTGDNAMPLVRYDIGDRGGVHSSEELRTIVARHEPEAFADLAARGVEFSALPFVYVFDRDDNSVSFYGITIYAEQLRGALQQPAIEAFVTGKCAAAKAADAEQHQYIDVHVELRRGVEPTPELLDTVSRVFAAGLRARCSEFRELSAAIGPRAAPHVQLHAYEDPQHFSPMGKQRWIKK